MQGIRSCIQIEAYVADEQCRSSNFLREFVLVIGWRLGLELVIRIYII